MTRNKQIVDHVLQFPCAECGKTAALAQKINPKGPEKFFNLLPLCLKHVELFKITPIDEGLVKLRNLYKYIKNKGWIVDDNALKHHDL